jgi:hypothetical protein
MAKAYMLEGSIMSAIYEQYTEELRDEFGYL